MPLPEASGMPAGEPAGNPGATHATTIAPASVELELADLKRRHRELLARFQGELGHLDADASAGFSSGIDLDAERCACQKARESMGEVVRLAVEKTLRLETALARVQEAFTATQERMESMAKGVGAAAKSAQEAEALLKTLQAQASGGRESIDRNASMAQEVSVALSGAEKTVALIQELAKNTAVLSFNASIEAARAGAHGAGFAVVAREIRLLAEQARLGSEKIQSSMRAATQKVGEANAQAQAARAAFVEIQEEASGAVNSMDALRARAEGEKKSAIELILDLTDLDESRQQLKDDLAGLGGVLEEGRGALAQAQAAGERLDGGLEELDRKLRARVEDHRKLLSRLLALLEEKPAPN